MQKKQTNWMCWRHMWVLLQLLIIILRSIHGNEPMHWYFHQLSTLTVYLEPTNHWKWVCSRWHCFIDALQSARAALVSAYFSFLHCAPVIVIRQTHTPQLFQCEKHLSDVSKCFCILHCTITIDMTRRTGTKKSTFKSLFASDPLWDARHPHGIDDFR